MDSDLGPLATDAYQHVAAELMAPLLEFVRLARASCGGDLDKFLVLLAIGLRTSRHRRYMEATAEDFMSGRTAILPGFGVYAQSIATGVGMPKETARRKVSEMVAAGWLVRQDRRLYLTAKCYQDLAPLRERLKVLAIAHYRTVQKMQVQSRAAR